MATKTKLQWDADFNAIQGFAPTSIVEVTAGASLDVSGYTAIRTPFPADYQLNGVGATGTMVGVTVINKDVTSIKFINATTIETM